MKTKTTENNKKAMKTKVNHILLATLISTVFICGNVTAEGNELKPLAMAEQASEPSLTVENWMLDNLYWNTEKVVFFSPEKEKPLLLESWMSDEKIWENPSTKIKTDDEKQMKVEEWMTDQKFWRNK